MANETNLVLGLKAREAQLEKDLKKAQRHLKRFEKRSNTISAGINKSMVQMFSVFSAGVIARDIFQTVAGFEKQMDKVRAISGATAKQMDELSKSAQEIGRASKFTATEIGQLQEELARLGFVSDEIVDATDAIRKLATAADSELGEAAKTTAATINAFNLTAKDSDQIANIMAESFAKSALSMEKFSVGMGNVGAAANAAGYDVAQTTAMLGALNDAGIDASKAGTDLRTIFIELAKSGMSLETAYSTILGSQDKLSTAVNLFGKRAANAAIILAENQEKVRGLHGELSDANIELDEMVGIMEDNLITDLQKLKSAWDGWILSLEDGSGKGAGAIRTMVKATTDLLNGLADWETFTNGTDWEEIAEQNKRNAQVLEEVNRIIGGITFDNISVETMEYADAMKTLESRLSAFTSNRYYEDIAEQIKQYQAELKKANDEQLRKNEIDRAAYAAFEKLKNASTTSNLSTLGTDGPQLAEIGPLQISNEGFEASKEMLAAKYADINAFILSQGEMLNATMRDSVSGAIGGFADGIATGGIEQALNNIAIVFAEGISRIGDQLITYGVTMLAAKKALANPFTNPAVAIAAGIAAKVAASALRGAIQSNSANIAGGGGNAGGGGGSGSFQNNVQGQSITLGGELKIKGKDLVYVFNENTRGNARLQG